MATMEEFEEVFGKNNLRRIKTMIKAKGKVKQIKTTDNRRAILLDSDERWFSIFENTKGLDEAPMIVANIDENLSKGDYVSMEVAKNTKGFWNIRGLEIEKDINDDMEEEPKDEELFEEKPQKKKSKDIDTVQILIIAQSTLKAAVETVASYDLGGMKEEIDTEIGRVWGDYFQRVIKLA